jgi:hypothetical protein
MGIAPILGARASAAGGPGDASIGLDNLRSRRVSSSSAAARAVPTNLIDTSLSVGDTLTPKDLYGSSCDD